MATIPCLHPSPLSESEDWYRPQAPAKMRPVNAGYEIKKLARHHHVKQSYAAKILSARRRRIYEEAIALLLANSGAVVQPQAPAVANERARFECCLRQQAEQWDRETAHLSSPLQRMMHPSYQAILGMGAESATKKRDVIRFLLRDLKQNRRDWLLALSYLTHENPINPKDSGKTDKMIKSWVKWGEEQGLL